MPSAPGNQSDRKETQPQRFYGRQEKRFVFLVRATPVRSLSSSSSEVSTQGLAVNAPAETESIASLGMVPSNQNIFVVSFPSPFCIFSACCPPGALNVCLPPSTRLEVISTASFLWG